MPLFVVIISKIYKGKYIVNLISSLNCLKLTDPSVDMTAEECVELDSDLINANLPTEEEIL